MECNWRHAHFCYVEMGCDGLEIVDVIKSEWSDDLKAEAGGEGDVGYSYAMCQNANCYGSTNFDQNPECPFGERCLTCGMVKQDYYSSHVSRDRGIPLSVAGLKNAALLRLGCGGNLFFALLKRASRTLTVGKHRRCG